MFTPCEWMKRLIQQRSIFVASQSATIRQLKRLLNMPQHSSKYNVLIRILDNIRDEAKSTKWSQMYAVGETENDAVQQARAKAFIHLYLKVMFGIFEFADRETYITDGSQDGGIDGFYIDHEQKRIHLIQSKFRNTERNFEQKEIAVEEILSMDIDRITKGYTEDESGKSYNGKIQGLIRKISMIEGIARYNYEIAIIANCNLSGGQLRRITDGFRASVFNFERSYRELVFPMVSGTFFRAEDVTILLDLSNKSAGAKTSYTVNTADYLCEITVLFIPTLEIAKNMDRYRNSILEFNPRSYVDLQDGKHVHSAIRETLLREDSNEFALMNNGITFLSDETNISERIGQHNRAQLRILKPQIINGGQTAYTLSRIYNENKATAGQIFAGKEVLTKIITLTPKDSNSDTSSERLRLIEEISVSSNKQTPVVAADRVSNDDVYKKLQSVLFDDYGLFFERKRGEFSDGINSGYLKKDDILDRNLFSRLLLISKGQIRAARRRRAFMQYPPELKDISNKSTMNRCVEALKIFLDLTARNRSSFQSRQVETLAKVFISIGSESADIQTNSRSDGVEKRWAQLISLASRARPMYTRKAIDQKTGTERTVFSHESWMSSAKFQDDIIEFVETGSLTPIVGSVKTRKAQADTLPKNEKSGDHLPKG